MNCKLFQVVTLRRHAFTSVDSLESLYLGLNINVNNAITSDMKLQFFCCFATLLTRVLWAGILHLAQPLSWADTLSGFFELSWAELAQGVLSQIEPAWAGSTQLKDWASLSWEDLELSNWARLSWSCFSLSQLELDRYFMNFWGKKIRFFDQKCHSSPFFWVSSL